MANRNEVKALLARAGVEISDAIKTVDKVPERELDTIAEKIKGMEVAFFDFNGSCGSISKEDLVAFFDFNGSCGANLTHAIDRALNIKRRM